MPDSISRRSMIVSGTLSVAATAFAHPFAAMAADARPLNEAEQANVKLVEDFLGAWNDPHLDIDKLLARYMAPNVAVRWFDDAPVAHGLEAAANAAKAGMPPGSLAIIKIHRTFAYGPLVATSRRDTIKVPGKPDSLFDAAGVHIVRDGKIQEYTDYVLR